MNAKPSAEKLPDPIRKVIGTEPAVSSRLASGMQLADILSSPAWASEWAVGADPSLRRIFGWLLVRYAAIPFGEEKVLEEAQRQSGFTGAELRVALNMLRRAGALYAVRKAWGDRLYYVPTDMVPVWQRLLLPVPWRPLAETETSGVRAAPSPYRLPLSLELLSVWALISNQPIPLTAKGVLPKPASTRLASAMRLKPEHIACLRLVYPQQNQIPSSAALAIDLGLAAQFLVKRDHEIAVSKAGLGHWLPHTVASADAELHRLAVQRFASLEPGCHLAASAVVTCEGSGWFCEEDVLRIGIDAGSLDTWLDVLAAFGWAERGTFGGAGVFRLLIPLDEEKREFYSSAPENVFIQPDGDIYVPPGVGLETRWRLEELAEKTKSDRVFIYRLTRSSCARAFEKGWRETDVLDFLERISGSDVPKPVVTALRDWFGKLGRVRLQEIVLLRTDSEQTARRLMEDSEASAWLGERLGPLDFIVDRAKFKAFSAVLEKLGYPSSSAGANRPLPDSGEEAGPEPGQGWICCRQAISMYEPDRTLSAANGLFPGLSEVPQAWLRQPGAYHSSTRRQLVQQALGWGTALKIGNEIGRPLFVPQSIDVSGEEWQVRGRWQTSNPDPVEGKRPDDAVTLAPDRLDALMIVLPQWDGVT